MRSFARLFSSSRRAPPKAASKPYLIERLLQAFRLPHVGVQRAVIERIDAFRQRFGILIDEQLHAGFARGPVAQRVHVAKLPGRIDVQQRKRRARGIERLLRQVQHHGAVLADRVQHHRPLRLGDDLAHDVNALGLEAFEMSELAARCCVHVACSGRHRSELWDFEGRVLAASRRHGSLAGNFQSAHDASQRGSLLNVGRNAEIRTQRVS